MPGKKISKSKEPGLAALAKAAPEAVERMGKDPNNVGMMRGGMVKMMRGGQAKMMRGGQAKAGYMRGGQAKAKKRYMDGGCAVRGTRDTKMA